jgi:hypothetical protein
MIFFTFSNENVMNLAKLDDGLDESPTVMVVDKKQKTKNRVKIGAN